MLFLRVQFVEIANFEEVRGQSYTQFHGILSHSFTHQVRATCGASETRSHVTLSGLPRSGAHQEIVQSYASNKDWHFPGTMYSSLFSIWPMRYVCTVTFPVCVVVPIERQTRHQLNMRLRAIQASPCLQDTICSCGVSPLENWSLYAS